MRNQLLLLDDVEDVGRSGDVVSVKPGYARNYLIPQKKGVVADKYTLRLQAKLQEERSKRADIDRKEAEGLAQKIEGIVLEIRVKVDPDGNMYGSVAQTDILNLLEGIGIKLERRSIILLHPIKSLGVQTINLKLKEGIPTSFTLKIVSESAPLEELPMEHQEQEEEEEEEPQS